MDLSRKIKHGLAFSKWMHCNQDQYTPEKAAAKTEEGGKQVQTNPTCFFTEKWEIWCLETHLVTPYGMQHEPRREILLPKQQRGSKAQIHRIRRQSHTSLHHLGTSGSDTSPGQRKTTRNERFHQTLEDKCVRRTRKMNYLRPLAAGALEAVGDLDHLGVRQPIKGIKNCAEKQSSLLVWNCSTQVGAQALSLSQRVRWEQGGVRRTKKRGWKWTQEQWVARPSALTPHQTLSRAKVLVRSGMFQAAWIWRKQSSIPRITWHCNPMGYHLPYFYHFFLDFRLCRLEVFLAVSKGAQGYYAFIFLTRNPNCPSLLGLTQAGRQKQNH